MHMRSVSAVVFLTPLLVAVGFQNVASVKAQAPDTTSPIQLIPRTKAEREQKYQDQHRISLIVQVAILVGQRSDRAEGGKTLSVLDNQKPQQIEKFREVNGKHLYR